MENSTWALGRCSVFTAGLYTPGSGIGWLALGVMVGRAYLLASCWAGLLG